MKLILVYKGNQAQVFGAWKLTLEKMGNIKIGYLVRSRG